MVTQTIQNSTASNDFTSTFGVDAISNLIAKWKLDYHLIEAKKAYKSRVKFTGKSRLLTNEYERALARGEAPDLTTTCKNLFNALFSSHSTKTPIDFIPILNDEALLETAELSGFLTGSKGSCVLVDDPLLKVILIKWQPGQTSLKHGHAGAGGVIKVLRGSIAEKCFDIHTPTKLISESIYHSGGIAYIDDNQALHQVSNPSDSSAITLHAYIKG